MHDMWRWRVTAGVLQVMPTMALPLCCQPKADPPVVASTMLSLQLACGLLAMAQPRCAAAVTRRVTATVLRIGCRGVSPACTCTLLWHFWWTGRLASI